MADWKPANGKTKPLELADDDWVEVECYNGARNQRTAGNVLWHSAGEAQLPYWAVIWYRPLPPSPTSEPTTP